MSQTTIEVKTPRGMMPVHVSRPDADKAAPVVVLYMDAPGIRPALHGHAERLAGAGYTALLPDLYYHLDADKRPNAEKLAAGDREEFARMQEIVARMEDDAVLEDTRLLLAMLREQLERHHVTHRIDVLPGAEHGYTMPGRPAYNPQAAERAWAGTLDLFGERL